MSAVWRKLQRTNKKAAKYRYTFAFKELILDCAEKWRPEQISIACMHRRRRYSSKPRKLETSFHDPSRCMVVWPDGAPDSIDLVTTLFRDPRKKDEFDDKEWTVIVEEVTDKGRYRPLAAVSINVRLFLGDGSPVFRTMAKLKLRPLREEVKGCSMQVYLSSVLLHEGDVREEDLESLPSQAEDVPSGTVVDAVAEKSHLASREPVPVSLPDERKRVSVDDNESVTQDGRRRVSGLIEPTTPPSAIIRPPWRVPSVKADERRALGAHRDRPVEELVTPDVPPIQPDVVMRQESRKAQARPPPEIKPNEDLLAWCKRVTSGYRGIRITDFANSWKSGLPFCAIIHRYRPELIEDYEHLDFSGYVPGQKENCVKAFNAASKIGVAKSLDESQLVTLPSAKAIRQYLEQLRRKLEGTDDTPDGAARAIGSDHRISAMFGLSAQEESVMVELERLKREREDADAVDLRGVPHQDDQQDPQTSRPTSGRPSPRKGIVNGSQQHPEDEVDAKTLAEDVRNLRFPIKGGSVPADERKKARHVLENPSTAVLEGSIDADRQKRLRDEARRLMEAALNERGPSEGEPGKPLRRSASIRSTTSLGSNTDLRTLGVVEPQITFHTFKKHQPSPILQRKTYEKPLLPAYSRPTQRVVNGSSNEYHSYHNGGIKAGTSTGLPIPTAFDRAKRYGSMRSQELAESIAQFVSPRRGLSVERSPAPSHPSQQTPTRKLDTKFEKDLSNANISEELQEINNRIAEVEKLDAYIIEQKMSTIEPGSEDEQKAIEEHLKLLTEKAALVRKLDYLNSLADLHETRDRLAGVRRKLHEMTSREEIEKTEEEKRQVDILVEELKELVDKENDLALALDSKEAEEEEETELGRQTLERSRQHNFSRGREQPLSASKRIFTWLTSS